MRLIIFVIIAWYIAIGLGTRQPEVTITAVSVTGGKQVTASEVNQVVFAYLEKPRLLWWRRDNRMLLGKRGLTSYLETEIPALREILINWNKKSGLEISISEHEPAALWCNYEQSAVTRCQFMTDAAWVYGPAPQYSDGIYVEYVWRTEDFSSPPFQALDIDSFNHLERVRLALTDLGLGIMRVERVNQYDIRWYLNGYPRTGSYVVMDYDMVRDPDRATVLLGHLATFLQSDPFIGKMKAYPDTLQYIDARLEDKIYFKLDIPKNESAI